MLEQPVVEVVAAHRAPERRDRVVENLLAPVEIGPRRDVGLAVREVAVPPAQRRRDEAQATLLVAEIEVAEERELQLGGLGLPAEELALVRPAAQDAAHE